jgi:hypothetical protein
VRNITFQGNQRAAAMSVPLSKRMNDQIQRVRDNPLTEEILLRTISIWADEVCALEAQLAEATELRAENQRLRAYEVLYPASMYHEDFGPVLWWNIPVCEPPTVGNVDDIENHTHFSRMPIVWDGDGQPKELAQEEPRSETS